MTTARHQRFESCFPAPGSGLLLLLGITATITLTTRAAPAWAETEELFRRSEIVTGLTGRQTVVTGFLLGGPIAEVAVLHRSEDGECRARLYAHDGAGWSPGPVWKLARDTSFVDVATIGGRDRVITYGSGVLRWLDPDLRGPDLDREQELVAVGTSFAPPRSDEIPHVDVTHDVNGDGRDDLLVPDRDGFWVLVQTSDGSFHEPVKLGPPADLSGILGADGYRYDPWRVARIHEIDFDQDGRNDLVSWSDGRFAVHLQNEHGRFEARSVRTETTVAFDSDDVFSLAEGDQSGRVLHSLSDLDGDGVADLLLVALEGRPPSRKRSAIEIHYGEASSDGGTRFADEAGATLESDGHVPVGLERLDLGHGRAALLVTTIETRYLEGSLWKKLRGAFGDDVRLGLELYRLGGRASGGFQPAAVYRIALDGVPSPREPGWVPLEVVLHGPTHVARRAREIWPRAFNRTLLFGDVTGDGMTDLLIEPEFTALHVFQGDDTDELFAESPRTVPVLLHDGEYAWLADLNGDDALDLVVHEPFLERTPHGGAAQPPGTEAHRITLLVSET